MSGMATHKVVLEGCATEESRNGEFEQRAHLCSSTWAATRASGRQWREEEKNIAEEVGAVAAGGRQGTAVNRENRISVRGHRGRIIARGS